MSDVAMESRCVKTIRVHVPDKRDFMLSDHKPRCNFFQQSALLVELAKSADCDFSCNRLAFPKKSVDHKQRSSQENDTKLR